MIDLSIIIVSWNVKALLIDCLTSIQNTAGELNIEIIVVDSHSVDDTVATIHQQFPAVNLLAQPENVGYTRGNNIGLRTARGRHLLLLNPDTVLLDNVLSQMVLYLDQHPDVGIVGPHTLNSDGSHQSTRRRFPTLATAFFESTWLQSFAPKGLLDRFYVRDMEDSATAQVDWVQGSALMARREVYEQIGGLDEGFIMFSEELDWCKRAQQAGWKAMYLGSARIIHHGGKSTEQVASRKHIHFQESKLRYVQKYHGKGAAELLRVFLLTSYAVQMGVESSKLLLRHKPEMRRARIAAYRDVLRSGLQVR